jgi:hypothetical protein
MRWPTVVAAEAVLGALLGLTGNPQAADLGTFLAEVERACRFDAPAGADVRIRVKEQGGSKRSYEGTVVAAGDNLYLELREPSLRVLARGTDSQVLLTTSGSGGGPRQVSGDDPIGSTTLVPNDFRPFRAAVQRNPQITSETKREMLVTGAPAGASPYVLLVYLLDRERRVPTRVQYYQGTINNLVRIRRDTELVQVAGKWRPGRSEIEDYRSGAVATIAFRWTAAPPVPPDLFNPATLGTRPPLGSPAAAAAPPARSQ